MPYSSEVLVRWVAMRQESTSFLPSKRPDLILVLPTSTTKNIAYSSFVRLFYRAWRRINAVGVRSSLRTARMTGMAAITATAHSGMALVTTVAHKNSATP